MVRLSNHRVRRHEGNNPYVPGKSTLWVVYDDQAKTELEMLITLDLDIDPDDYEIKGFWRGKRVAIMCAQEPQARFIRVWEE